MNNLFKTMLCGAAAVMLAGTSAAHPRCHAHTDLLGAGVCGPGRDEVSTEFFGKRL